MKEKFLYVLALLTVLAAAVAVPVVYADNWTNGSYNNTYPGTNSTNGTLNQTNPGNGTLPNPGPGPIVPPEPPYYYWWYGGYYWGF